MAILHGTWLTAAQLTAHSPRLTADAAQTFANGGTWFLWGEVWRKPLVPRATMPSPVPLPLALDGQGLARELQTRHHAQQLYWPEAFAQIGHVMTIALPTIITETELLPLHSATVLTADGGAASEEGLIAGLTDEGAIAAKAEATRLYPWQVEGYCLTPLQAIQFLQSLPLGLANREADFIGTDVRFWSHVARWGLDLLARCKFLPGLRLVNEGGRVTAIADWQPLLDSAVDQSRLETFARQFPPACRFYQPAPLEDVAAIVLPPAPATLIRSFLHGIIDAQVRAVAQSQPLPTNPSPLGRWLQALREDEPQLELDPATRDRLLAALTTWSRPVYPYLSGQQLFHACFSLRTPVQEGGDWSLDYGLQAADDPTFVVDAATIWAQPGESFEYQGRTIAQPQETLLMGLGLAARLYPLLEASLEVERPQSCTLTPLQAYEFLKTGVWRFQENGLGVILPPSLAQREAWSNRLGLKIRAKAGTDQRAQTLGLSSLLNFEWELAIAGQTLSQAEFERLVSLNSPLVQINGQWVELRPQDVKAAQVFFAERPDRRTLSLEEALRLSTGDTQTIAKLPVVNFEATGALQELLATLTNQRSLTPIDPPRGFRGELRPYQARGVGWLAFLERWGLGACLADDMGLGKTIQCIAFLLFLQEQGALDAPVLLICPTSVLGNWEREVRRFGPSLKTLVHHGDKRTKGKAFGRAVQGKHLIISSYALAYRDLKEFQQIQWRGLVIDEAQNIKNPQAKQAQAIRELSAHFRIALTGTPVENRLSELWSIMDFLNPGYLGPRPFFQRRFAIPIERYGDTDSLKTLRALVQPFILRRLKTDREIIQDLPEKQEMTVFCGLTPEQAALYQQTVDHTLAAIEAAEGIQRRGMILALLMRLKQICNHPLLGRTEINLAGTKTTAKVAKNRTRTNSTDLPKSQTAAVATAHFARSSGKLQRLDEMLEELLENGDHALIFTQFAEWGKLLKTHLEARHNREIFFLYGETRQAQREEMVDRFQHDPQGPPIMILSLKAGGVGLNLTRANHVFHYDRWWNPAVENQATDRAFRIGQTRNVQVHKFVCSGTLEERIHELLENKKALAEQVVGTGEDWLTELDTDQLRTLLLLDRNAVIETTEE
ncbi:DEAD/DEAH box helicase [Trichothermofontia sichuanensis B231]|uniref:DEAD/DEAH box helicase n=1 Tax=Trichothermofontia sichuanensis TaxID=3045816 RepID=UPI0022454B31|nr:DEAD/DEAH box helicase [Trichothermofontia sichuanensis]UZQ56011.1 DEAD/DEAH box helicase [Trichothermofontia sichuanensis B231]